MQCMATDSGAGGQFFPRTCAKKNSGVTTGSSRCQGLLAAAIHHNGNAYLAVDAVVNRLKPEDKCHFTTERKVLANLAGYFRRHAAVRTHKQP
jgi:hypothetical protein